jgi:2-haloacid dehalogenase
MLAQRSVVVFDLGGVVVDWNPRYLYRKLFNGNDSALEHFLATVCTQSWNEQQDAGRTFADACASLKLTHPGEAELIDAWFQRYDEMLAGEIPGTVRSSTEADCDRGSRAPLVRFPVTGSSYIPGVLPNLI